MHSGCNNMEIPESLAASDRMETPAAGEAVSEKGFDRSHPARMAIRNFSSIWFTISLDTGVLSVIMHQLPYQFSGLPVLSTIMFVLNLVLFSLISTTFLTRWVMFPKETLVKTFRDTEEIAFMGAPTIAYLTIVAQVCLTCSEAWGHGFTLLAYVLWWVGMAWAVFNCTMLYICLAKNSLTTNDSLPTAVFLPIVGVMTAAEVGGLIANFGEGISARLAEPIIIVGYLCLGYAIMLAVVMYAMYMHRLVATGWPEPAKIPGMILTIGPMGQSATALMLLGTAASKHKVFEDYDRGPFLKAAPAEIVWAASTLAAILLMGFGIFWICMAYYAIIESLCRKRLHLGLVWWSTIFPMGTMTTAVATLSGELDSPALRAISAGMLVFLLLIYFFNAFFTIPMTFSGKLLGVPHRNEDGATQWQDDQPSSITASSTICTGISPERQF